MYQQVLGAGAESLVYEGVCVAGKEEGRRVVVKLQPRHEKTKYQVSGAHPRSSILLKKPVVTLIYTRQVPSRVNMTEHILFKEKHTRVRVKDTFC